MKLMDLLEKFDTKELIGLAIENSPSPMTGSVEEIKSYCVNYSYFYWNWIDSEVIKIEMNSRVFEGKTIPIIRVVAQVVSSSN